jgi:hypothetical protein
MKKRSLQIFLLVETVLISAVLLLITKPSRSGNSSNKEVPSLSGSSANQNCYFRLFFAVVQLVEELR